MHQPGTDPEADLYGFLGTASDERVHAQPDGYELFNFQGQRHFPEVINDTLRQHRISFVLVDGRIVPFSSQEMHTAVVGPTLQLLAGNAPFTNVESKYLSALDEIADGHPEDAITDATTALQELLLSLGCKGNAIGPLTQYGLTHHLLTPYDRKLLDWASADRSQKGDAHVVTDASIDDVWLTVHVIGAFILRLSKRGQLRA